LKRLGSHTIRLFVAILLATASVQPATADVDTSVIESVNVDRVQGISGGSARGISGGSARGISGGSARGISGGSARGISGGSARGISGGSARGISGGSARGISGGSARGISGGSARTVGGDGLALIAPPFAQSAGISGTIEVVDEALGIAQIDGQTVVLGSSYYSDGLGVGAVVIVFGVRSEDGTLILADHVTVLSAAPDHIFESDLY
jgi:hypothetical protein